MVAFIPPKQAGKYKAVASGAITNGKPVIVNSTGTVSEISSTANAVDASVGSPTVFESAGSTYISATFDSNSNKVVIAYRDGGNSGYGTAVVGTISDTSISFGTPVVFESASTFYTSATFDSSNNKIVISYRDNGNSSHGTAIVGTVSGTGISFGSPTVFNSGSTEYTSATFDSNSNKVVIAYSDQGNSSYGTAIVGTVSGTGISFGSEAVFESASSKFISAGSATFDSSNNKVVITYSDFDNSRYGTAVVGTVSSTSISFGSPTVFNNTGATIYTSATFDPNSNKVVIAYQDQGNSQYGTAIEGTVSGTSISFSSALVFESASSFDVSTDFDSNANKIVIAYKDGGNSNYGTGIVFSSSNLSTNLTSENYIGIASGGTYADTAEATIDVVGTVNKDQTSLTAGQTYFVQTDGTLGTSADDPSVVAGTAISATELIVKG